MRIKVLKVSEIAKHLGIIVLEMVIWNFVCRGKNDDIQIRKQLVKKYIPLRP